VNVVERRADGNQKQSPALYRDPPATLNHPHAFDPKIGFRDNEFTDLRGLPIEEQPMWPNRILTLVFWGIVVLAWAIGQDFATADPANDTKTKNDATGNPGKSGKPKTAKSKPNASSADKNGSTDDEPAEKVVHTDAEWRKLLTPLQFRVTRKKQTEQAGTGKYAHWKKDGVYHCVCCGEPLFDSKAKFESGTGWPSFFQALDEKAITELEDTSDGSVRTEVQCSRCDAHLGHVFGDGPAPTGLRFCMNSASLKFVDRKKEQEDKDARSTAAKKAKSAPKDKADSSDSPK
jgi:peptide-methionine (R)-S-oxide reductase